MVPSGEKLSPQPSPRVSRRFLALLLIVVFAAIPGTTSLPPIDRDEVRFAQASAQMLESGDWIKIKFQDQERNKKPAGIYWLQAISVTLFSSPQARDIWAYRIPSILGAIFASLLTWRIGRQFFDNDTAFFGAMFLSVSPALMGEATLAKTDAMLLAGICASQFALACTYLPISRKYSAPHTQVHQTKEESVSSWPIAILFWASLGFCILIKGPIGPMIIMTTLIGLIAWPRVTNRKDYSIQLLRALKPLTGFIILGFLLLPWAIAIGTATEGRFFTQALGGDMLGKIATVQEHHSGPPGYHLLLLPILFWPLSALLFSTAHHIWRIKFTPAIWFLISWIAPAWVIFELTATKLPHYVLPLYPAIALLCAKTLMDLARGDANIKRVLWRTGIGIFALLGFGIAVALFSLPRLLPAQAQNISHLIVAVLIICATIGVCFTMLRENFLRSGLLMAALSLFTCASLLTLVLPSLTIFDLSNDVTKIVKTHKLHPEQSPLTANTREMHLNLKTPQPVMVLGYSEPSIVFQLGTDTFLTSDPELAAKTLLQPLKSFPPRAILVEKRYEEAFLSYLKRQNHIPTPLAKTSGLNYSNGKDITLTLYKTKTH